MADSFTSIFHISSILFSVMYTVAIIFKEKSLIFLSSLFLIRKGG